jgi:hypothetical protein
MCGIDPRIEHEERYMDEWQEFSNQAAGSASERAPALLPPRVPTLDDDGRLLLEPGEAGIGSLPASGVRFRSRSGSVEQRWGPLDMCVTLTTHRVVLIASPGTPAGAPWSTRGSVPVALRAIEPSQPLRRVAPVRIAGHVRWNSVTRVESDCGRICVTMAASHGEEASLVLQVPSQLGHRFLGIARAAFVAAKRQLSVDTPNRVEASVTR